MKILGMRNLYKESNKQVQFDKNTSRNSIHSFIHSAEWAPVD